MVIAPALAVLTLTACGASAPPAKELAVEAIDSLDLPEEVKECMREHVESFEGELLDDIADRAASDNADALADLAEFEQALADCRSR